MWMWNLLECWLIVPVRALNMATNPRVYASEAGMKIHFSFPLLHLPIPTVQWYLMKSQFEKQYIMSQDFLSTNSATSIDAFPAGYFSFVYWYQILYFHVFLLNYVFFITCILTMHKEYVAGQHGKCKLLRGFSIRTPNYMNTAQSTFG